MTGDYKFILLGAETGTAHELTLICVCDSDAMLIAGGIGGGCDVEVWDETRLVGRVRARRPTDVEIAA